VGKTYIYGCGLCQYRVKVSGGPDSGLDCDVLTIVCRDCRELFDVFTRVRRLAATAGKFKSKHLEIPPVALPSSPARQAGWQSFKPACPANPKHRIESWQDPGRCPRCGSYLEKTGLPFRLWD
jgi:hypothetical protein